jgi:hypothetical protein
LVDDELEEDADDEAFESEPLPQAETPRHMIMVQAAAAAFRKVVLRMGSTIPANLDFPQFRGLYMGRL